MNKLVSYLLILFFIGLIYISCDKEVVYPPLDTISPTTVGFDNVGNIVTSDNPISYEFGSYSLTYKNNVVVFFASYDPVESIDAIYSVNIKFHAKTTGTYLLSNKDSGIYTYSEPRYYYYSNYYTDSIHTGTIKLTLLDTVNHVASGTFSFVAESQYGITSGDTIRSLETDTVTNGYFNYLKW
jgi:hypothetical protein